MGRAANSYGDISSLSLSVFAERAILQNLALGGRGSDEDVLLKLGIAASLSGRGGMGRLICRD
jgi:hypothetical protein